MNNISVIVFFTFIFTSFTFIASSNSQEGVYIVNWDSEDQCMPGYRITHNEYCKNYDGHLAHTNFTRYCEIIENEKKAGLDISIATLPVFCSISVEHQIIKDTKKIESVKTLTDYELCDEITTEFGFILKKPIYIKVKDIRKISDYECNKITGRYTLEQEAAIAEFKKQEIKKKKISAMKVDCEDLGFLDGTEAMGNCVLKLMEIESKTSYKIMDSPTIVTTTTSNSSQEIVDIEKQKLQAQREALKLQQDQLKAEQERVAQERRKAIQRNANKSIRQGQCLMNGGSTWDCM